jgi:phage terminase small subunit
MGERGRKNALEASVVPINGLDRPKPPSTLTDEQSVIWVKVVDALPADWFRPEAAEVLAQYCRHAITAKRVADLIKRMESEVEFDVQDYDRLLKMQEREGRALSSLATRLRITPQATRDSKSKKPNQVKRPWEI